MGPLQRTLEWPVCYEELTLHMWSMLSHGQAYANGRYMSGKQKAQMRNNPLCDSSNKLNFKSSISSHMQFFGCTTEFLSHGVIPENSYFL